MLERQAVARPRKIRTNRALDRHRRTVEKHSLDPDMIVKPFLMPETGTGAGGVHMQGWRAMSGKVDVKGLA